MNLKTDLERIECFVSVLQLVFPHWECPKYMAIHKSILRNPEPNTAIYEFYQMHADLFANLSAYTGEV